MRLACRAGEQHTDSQSRRPRICHWSATNRCTQPAMEEECRDLSMRSADVTLGAAADSDVARSAQAAARGDRGPRFEARFHTVGRPEAFEAPHPPARRRKLT